MSANPEFNQNDPRVYGYDYEEGLVPNFAFDGQWGSTQNGPVPSSDGNGQVVRLSELQGRGTQQAYEQYEAANEPTPSLIEQLRQSQQGFTQEVAAQPVYQPAPTAPLYKLEQTAPLYQMPGEKQAPGSNFSAGSETYPPNFPAYSGAQIQQMQEAYAQRQAQAAAPQGETAGLTWRTMPPAVPASHAVQGYPWQGHKLPGAFMGPNGTSPMWRGGPNISAHADAPAPPTDRTGAAYPKNQPGTYVPNNGMTPFAGYAGLDFAGLDAVLEGYGARGDREARREERQDKREARKYEKSLIDYEDPKRGSYRDVAGKGGYFYRQFEDGTLRVMEKSPKLAGNVLYEYDQDLAKRKKWKAITNEIGTWDQHVSERRSGRLEAAGSILSAVGEALGKGKKRGKKRKKASADVAPTMSMDTEEPASEMPSWLIPAAIVTGIVVIFAVSNKGSEGGRKRKSDDE